MSIVLFLLFCFLSPKGLNFSAVVVGSISQGPGSVTVTPGENVTMSCRLNEVRSFCHTVVWAQVHPVSGERDMLKVANIHPQKENAEENAVCQATIHKATVQDTGMYYCIATDREHLHLGNGTAVTVQVKSSVMPSIEIMAFSSSSRPDSITLQCSVSGFSPSQLHLSWFIQGREETGETLFIWEDGDERSVKTQNYVVVSADEWRERGEGTCILELGGWTFNKTLHRYDIQDTCYHLISLTRVYTVSAALLFFITSVLLVQHC
ncbi:hypothetical protein DNTS_023841 [Danionella cerebrum]|uniref:Ig-like domain-containing protein n=1 Tax=Danionella cerebrum TaxID=2873325 RepID=A0A553QSW7_9TELE|nr:hypothetical protein DNTS_023841 [Danionella translucida]